jgi:hypothetical protein
MNKIKRWIILSLRGASLATWLYWNHIAVLLKTIIGHYFVLPYGLTKKLCVILQDPRMVNLSIRMSLNILSSRSSIVALPVKAS